MNGIQAKDTTRTMMMMMLKTRDRGWFEFSTSLRRTRMMFIIIIGIIILVMNHHGCCDALSLSSLSTVTTTTKTIRYRARVAYDGHNYRGFQLQTTTSLGDDDNKSQKTTVQGVLEDVLNRRFVVVMNDDDDDKKNEQQKQHHRVIKVVGAGRTDAGVHARGQAIHFDLPEQVAKTIMEQQQSTIIEASLNAMLPSDIRIWNLQKASEINTKTIRNNKTDDYAFHVIYDATRKWYSYRLALGPIMDPLQRHGRWHRHYPSHKNRNNNNNNNNNNFSTSSRIDPEYLQRILRYYEGTHDFRAFASSIEKNIQKMETKQSKGGAMETDATTTVDTVRTVHSVNLVLENEQEDWYRIDFVLQGALYKQVRNMVGTAMDVVLGNVSEQEFLQLLSMQPPSREQEEDHDPSSTIITRRQRQLPYIPTRCHNPSKPAPPQGLTLEHVYFDGIDANF